VPPYCDREGGFVCNVAIDRYATAIVSDAAGSAASDDESPLRLAVERRANLGRARLELRNDFPLGAGLGGSSAASAAMFVAAAEWRGERWDRAAIAELGRVVEVEDLGVAGGRQDHYAATFGGALGLEFTAAVTPRRLHVARAVLDELAERSTLVYTGQSRISGSTIGAVLGAYERGDARVGNALARMKGLAREMAAALERGDLDATAALVGEHWRFQRELHPSIPTLLIDDIIARAASAGALGAKAMGASGGGCVLALSRRGETACVRAAIAGLGTLIAFGVDTTGVTVVPS